MVSHSIALVVTCGIILTLPSYLVLATQAIANVVKSSFGPSGLDKMMVDDIGVGVSRIPRSECTETNYCERLGCYGNQRWRNDPKFTRCRAPSRQDPRRPSTPTRQGSRRRYDFSGPNCCRALTTG